MYSWAEPSRCMNADEFNVSKSILFHQLKKKEYIEHLQIDLNVDQGSPYNLITRFYNEHVFPHEDRFVFYQRKNLYNLESHTNCGIEGCQNGIKNSASPCTPLTRLDNTVYRNTTNAKIKMDDKMTRLSRKSHATKIWSESPTSKYLTDISESIITKEWTDGCN